MQPWGGRKIERISLETVFDQTTRSTYYQINVVYEYDDINGIWTDTWITAQFIMDEKKDCIRAPICRRKGVDETHPLQLRLDGNVLYLEYHSVNVFNADELIMRSFFNEVKGVSIPSKINRRESI
jgi:hypothetical protein